MKAATTAGSSSRPKPQNPFDIMRRVGNVLDNTQQVGALTALSPHQLFEIALACVCCGWDVTPCDLTHNEVLLVLRGQPRAFEASLNNRLGGAS